MSGRARIAAIAWLASAACGSLTSVAIAQTPAPLPTPYAATFAVDWKGISAGTSTLELKQTAANEYQYVSTSVARGLARLFVSDAVTQTSQFRIENGGVLPRSFSGVDEKQRKTQIEFDWPRARVSGTARDSELNLELTPGAQDPLSLQILTTRQLAAGQLSPQVRMFDGDQFKEFEQRREGTARLNTALGTLDTVIVATQRQGSDRVTRTWFAPSLGYVPVQAQRLRGGKVEVTLRIRSLKR